MHHKPSEQFFPIGGHQYPDLTEVDFKIIYIKFCRSKKCNAKIEIETKTIIKQEK